MQIDAGHLLSDQTTATGLSDEARVRNEWVLRGLAAVDPAALNVSYRDLGYLSSLTAKADYAKNAKAYPMLERFISANVAPRDPAMRPFAPYVIREIKGKRLGGKPLRVGIIGLTELPSGMSTGSVKIDIGGYTITDPIAAAAKYVPELRAKCDILIAAVYLDRDASQRLGTTVPGIDAVLSAHQYPLIGRIDEAGDAVVAYAANETKWLGELRLYRSEGGKAGQIASYIHRDVPLDAAVPDEPGAARSVADAKAAIEAARHAAGKVEGTHR